MFDDGFLKRRRLVLKIHETWKLSPIPSEFVTVLYEARGVPISWRQIVDRMDHWHADCPDADNVKVLVNHVRTKCGATSIETVKGFGYRLSDEMRHRVQGLVG